MIQVLLSFHAFLLFLLGLFFFFYPDIILMAYIPMYITQSLIYMYIHKIYVEVINSTTKFVHNTLYQSYILLVIYAGIYPTKT